MSSDSNTIDPYDFLDVDALFTDEEKMVRATVRSFVRDKVLPDINDWFEAGTPYPKELFREMGRLGLFGMHLEGYGCAGMGAVAYGVACEEVEYGDAALRSSLSVQGSLAMFPIWKFGSEEQKQRWLPGMAAGDICGCFGLTEAESGSDPSSMRTRARKDGSDWILDGSKAWISNGTIADMAIVWARAEDGTIRGFTVPTDTPGFEAREIPNRMSLRASRVSELAFTNLRLSEEHLLPGVQSMRGPLSCLSEARYGIIWGVIGAARACFESALDYGKQRQQFGKPLAAFQLSQKKYAAMVCEISKAQLLALHLGRLKEQGVVRPEQISLGKMNNVREALKISREARSMLGGNGIALEFHIIRHMLNLESVYTYEGTNEVHELILGNAVTGIPAFA